MVLVQKWPFLQLLFLKKYRSGICLLWHSRTKKRLLGYKKKKFKKSKNWPKGLAHGFGPKMAIFPPSFFRQYRPGKCLLWYSGTKNAFLGYKNKKFKRSKNWHFSKGDNPWFWSKHGHFSSFYFKGNTSQGNVFHDILERKNAFLVSKHQKFKQSKNWYFSKGVSPWFWSKKGHFCNFCF